MNERILCISTPYFTCLPHTPRKPKLYLTFTYILPSSWTSISSRPLHHLFREGIWRSSLSGIVLLWFLEQSDGVLRLIPNQQFDWLVPQSYGWFMIIMMIKFGDE